MIREFMYILDYSASRVIKTKIAISESHLEDGDLVDAVMCRLHLNRDTCAWMISSEDVEMEEIPIEKIPAKDYAMGLKGSHPELSVWYHPNPAHNIVVVGRLEGNSNLEIDRDFWNLLVLDSDELGVKLTELRSADQVQNLIEVEEYVDPSNEKMQ